MEEPNNSIRIAIIDDHILFRQQQAVRLHHSNGIDVIFEASNGVEMQEKITQFGLPDAILMDIEMPVMNGYQSTRWLAEHHPKVKVIACSLFHHAEVVAAMYRCGAHGFLQKGIATHDIISTLQEVITSPVPNHSEENADVKQEIKAIELLSERQLQLLLLCDSDDTYETIACKMKLSIHTTKRYGSELYKIFGVHSRPALLREARKMGLLPLH